MINNKIDLIFYILVFVSSIYFIILQESIIINTVGWIIFFAHLYQLSFNIVEWPWWCEYIGLIMAVCLVIEGNRIGNLYAFGIGVLKFVAHMRQLILKDGGYYY